MHLLRHLPKVLASLRSVLCAAGLCLPSLLLTGVASAKTGYLRFPDIHGDGIVFSAEGDLWTVSAQGGEAQRLTTHVGSEVLARYSPDGAWIVFAGDYDGNRDLFVMPATGGEPRRLTWHPAADEPLAWSKDGSAIYFRSNRAHPHSDGELYRIPAQGGDPEKVAIGPVVNFDLDSQSGRWAFTRLGGGGTWKRYRGGTAPEIWVGDPERDDFAQVTQFAGMDAFPMWHGDRIFFLSDMGGTANLWSMKADGSERTRLTDLGAWDARFPSMDETGRIVFMLAGDIHLYDPSTQTERALTIDLPSERILTRKRYPEASGYLTEYALAPDGERLAVVTRGEAFSVAAKDGVTIPVSRGSGARESRLSFDPDGKRIVYVTDQSGEEQIVTADAWGRGDVQVVTQPGKSAWHFPPLWSPDGKHIAYADQTQSLFVVPAKGGDPAKVDSAEQGEIRDYTWSPDGRWLAYSKPNRNDWIAVFIYDTREKVSRQVTTWTTDSRSPAWDPEGRYLYFLSDRTINPVVDWRDFETIVIETTRPYLLLLRPDVKNPLANLKGAPPGSGGSEDDEGKDAKKDDGKEDKGKDKAEEKAKPIEIVFDGLAERVVEIPVEPGRYFGLTATAKKLFYIETPLTGLSEDWADEDNEPRANLISYDLEDREAKTFLKGISGYDLQAKKGKMAVMKKRGDIYILEADSPPDDDLSKKKVSLNDVVVELNPIDEWNQIYAEGWRVMRDFYWDEGMHGVDWAAIRDQYGTLIPRIATRDELRDVMAELIGELSTSHTYVWGGDRGIDVPSRATGLLGAELSRRADGFRVDRVYRADPADRIRSALSEPGVEIKEGDVITAVNNLGFSREEPFEARLEALAGKEVLLTVHPSGEAKKARTVVAKTMRPDQDFRLRYADWVRRNREYVAEKSGDRIGYIHIPDMGGRGLREFDTWFYPQLDKEGMVVDVRYNGGGFVSQLIVSRFMRHLLWWDRSRWGSISTYPYRVLNGPFVVLTNENAGSDGDIFPAAIQTAKLAPVIGKRSWGGVIGIRGGRSLVDMGALTQPEFAWWHPSQGWGVENHGVDPDIVVENLPQEIHQGKDAQLDRGIEEVLKLHRERGPMKPVFAPAPDRSRRSYAGEQQSVPPSGMR